MMMSFFLRVCTYTRALWKGKLPDWRDNENNGFTMRPGDDYKFRTHEWSDSEPSNMLQQMRWRPSDEVGQRRGLFGRAQAARLHRCCAHLNMSRGSRCWLGWIHPSVMGLGNADLARAMCGVLRCRRMVVRGDCFQQVATPAYSRVSICR